MKKSAFLSLIGLFCAISTMLGQNVMSSTDAVNNYPGAASAVLPAAGKIGKWYKTTRMSWSTTSWKPYIYNGMAYRLRFPKNYNPADTVTKYPLIIFFHGGGEIATINDNEYQLLWGAKQFQDSIEAGKFNAFMLFPQVSAVGWDLTYLDRINTVLDTLKKYNNLDEDRIISMGLSNGGFGANLYSIFHPKRSSVVIASSPALVGGFTEDSKKDFIHIPLYLSSGGEDNNPSPSEMQKYVDSFAAKGGDIKWSFFPDLGHLTWEQQWAEGNLVNYWNRGHKANPIVFFQKNVYCADSIGTSKIGITAGFAEYQWQKDGVDMSNSNTNEISVSAFGTYRVRFRRIANGPWSVWSPRPAVISARAAVATPTPVIVGLRSRVLPASDGSTTVPLILDSGYNAYEWRRVSDNVLVSTARTYNAPAGQYKGLIVGCSRTPSATFTVVNANGTPKPDIATTVAAVRASATRVNLTWSLARVTNVNPAFYEIYRSTSSNGPLTLIAVRSASLTRSYADQADVDGETVYFYKIRSVSESAASALSNEATSNETTAPTQPTNFRVVNTGKTFVTLDWNNSTDNVSVVGYDVYVGGVKRYTTSESAITAGGLNPNTAYTFTVRARDLSNNLSTVSASVSSTTSALANGLKYRWYQGTWDSLPNFNELTHVKAGTSTTPDLAARNTGVNDNFGFVWEGHIIIPSAGTYTFELASDDGSKLYMDEFYSPDSVALVNNDGAHGDLETKSGTVTLTAGAHPIAMTYFEIAGGESMKLYWTGPGIPRQLVPASAYVEVIDNTAPTTPGSLVASNAGKTTVDLKWNASTDAVGVIGYNIYRNDTLDITTVGSALAVTVDSLKSNTSYTFKVKARDAAGNLSAFSNAVTISTSSLASGLKYKYYEGNWDSLPNFNLLTPLKTGTTPNIDISVRNTGVNDYFGFVWEGYITIPTSGVYTFETGSDDGSKFYWNTLYNPNAVALVNNDYGHGETPTVSKSIEVAAGVYPVTITYFEKWGGEAMKLFWTGPGIARAQVPNSAFIEAAPINDVAAPTTPANMRVTYTGKNTVSLAWDNSTDNVGVTGYDFYINNVKKVTSLSTTITVDTLTAGTLYSFKVQARDAANNLSPMSATVSTTTTVASSGLTYKYYEGTWDSLPNFNALTPVKTGVSANADISVRPAGVNDYFAFLWDGRITIPTTGQYTFELSSDDGSKLYLGTPYSPTATATINNDYGHGETPIKSVTLTLQKGVYPFALSYFEIWGGEAMKIYWTGPGITRQLIPNSAFIETTIAADTTAPTTPANFKSAYTGRTFVDLTWDNSTDVGGVVTGYDVYVNGSTTPITTTTNKLTVSGLTPNTANVIRVQAKDDANNLSAFATVNLSSTASGLRYKYYEGDWSVLPNFNTLTPVKTGTTANIDVTPKNLDDYYAFVWEGYINIPNTGSYTFELSSDDGSKFYFNTLYNPAATALVDNDGAHGDQPTVSASRTITAGIYPVAITYFEKWGGENMKLYWSGPGFTRQLVPNAAFTENFNVTLNSLIGGTGVAGMSTVDMNSSESALRIGQEKPVNAKAFPNPFNNKVQVQFNNPASGNHVTVSVHDLSGKMISNKDLGSMSAGNSTVTLSTGSEVKPGVYVIRLNINGVPSGMWKMVKEKK